MWTLNGEVFVGDVPHVVVSVNTKSHRIFSLPLQPSSIALPLVLAARVDLETGKSLNIAAPARVVSALREAGLEGPRQGKAYITAAVSGLFQSPVCAARYIQQLEALLRYQ